MRVWVPPEQVSGLTEHALQADHPPFVVPHACEEEPLQLAPPPEGGGLVQVRVWVQLEQALQADHPPSMAQA